MQDATTTAVNPMQHVKFDYARSKPQRNMQNTMNATWYIEQQNLMQRVFFLQIQSGNTM